MIASIGLFVFLTSLVFCGFLLGMSYERARARSLRELPRMAAKSAGTLLPDMRSPYRALPEGIERVEQAPAPAPETEAVEVPELPFFPFDREARVAVLQAFAHRVAEHARADRERIQAIGAPPPRERPAPRSLPLPGPPASRSS